MVREDMRRWVAARRAGEERERRELARAGAPADSIPRALRLIALGARQLGWPFPEDPVSRREDERARERWALLKRGHVAR